MQQAAHIKRKFRPLLAKGILYAYLISIFGLVLESGHSHESKSGACKADHQSTHVDLCHLRLDHHDLLNGCKHTEHISNTTQHCLLCDVLLHFDFAIVSIDFYCLHDTCFEINPFQLDSHPLINLIGLNNKAPPSLIS